MKSILTIARQQKSAFSLVELLAALAVLTILGLLISQITFATISSTRLSNRTIDSASQARFALDRIGIDLAGLINRSDIDFYAGNNISNAGYYADYDTSRLLMFFSGVTSPDLPSGSNRGISVISYCIGVHPDNPGSDGVARPALLRAGRPIPWTPGWKAGSGFFGLKANGLPVRLSDTLFPSSLVPVSATGTAGNSYDLLAPGVIRMVVGYQLYPDNQPVTLAGSTTSFGNSQGQIVYDAPLRTITASDGVTTSTYIDLNRVSSLVVGLVALDNDNLKLINAANVDLIARQFPIPSDTANKLPVQLWETVASGLTSSLSGSAPKQALQAVHVYQRVYPITPFPSKSP